jgi:hypothetical protein
MADRPPEQSPLGRSPGLLFLRYWLPGIICLVGIVYGMSRNLDETGLEGAVLGVAAGSSLWLITMLMRVGIVGDKDRDEEDRARAFFDEHGRWPDDPPPP